MNGNSIKSHKKQGIYMTTRGYAQGVFGQVHFYDTGGTGMPVMLCHQAPMTARQFDAAYSHFANRKVRAIGVDYPGFGMSDAPVEPASISDYANAVLDVMDHLTIEQADIACLLYTSPSPRDATLSRMPSSA